MITTITDPQPEYSPRSQQRIRGIADARPVATVFFLAYAFSWVGWLPVVTGMGEPIRTLSFVAGGFGPALAGAVVTWLDGGSVRAWARQIVRWRVAPRWYSLKTSGLPTSPWELRSREITKDAFGVFGTAAKGRCAVPRSNCFGLLFPEINRRPVLHSDKERHPPVC